MKPEWLQHIKNLIGGPFHVNENAHLSSSLHHKGEKLLYGQHLDRLRLSRIGHNCGDGKHGQTDGDKDQVLPFRPDLPSADHVQDEVDDIGDHKAEEVYEKIRSIVVLCDLGKKEQREPEKRQRQKASQPQPGLGRLSAFLALLPLGGKEKTRDDKKGKEGHQDESRQIGGTIALIKNAMVDHFDGVSKASRTAFHYRFDAMTDGGVEEGE